MRKLLTLIFLVGLLAGCSSATEPEATKTSDASEEAEGNFVDEVEAEEAPETTDVGVDEPKPAMSSGLFDPDSAASHIIDLLSQAESAGILICERRFEPELFDTDQGPEVVGSCETALGTIASVNTPPRMRLSS